MLGQPWETNRYKVYYLIFMVLILAFLGFSWIGQQNPAKRSMIEFYAWLGLLSFVLILFDNLTLKSFRRIDTVTVENVPVSVKVVLAVAVFISMLSGYMVVNSQSAFISYPVFYFFDSKFADAILSGIAGIIENWFFFGCMLPIVVANAYYFTKDRFKSIVLGVMVTSTIFMFYHIFVYHASQHALVMTFLFAVLNSILVIGLRTLLLSDAFHFSNNVIASLINAGMALVLR